MTIRELYEAVPDEHKDDILCVYDENHNIVEAVDIWTTQAQAHRLGALCVA